VYSRETNLNERSALHIEVLPSPAVLLSPSGEDSLLVYTYENTLYHYIINAVGDGVHLVQVGQIAFHGIVRAPARVRAVSWVLPDNQLRESHLPSLIFSLIS
jgi:RAB6A-GEF complex partner protein 1